MESTARSRRRAQQVLDFIEANPEKHNQETWFNQKSRTTVEVEEGNICNTSMCIAGTAVFIHHGPKALLNPWEELDKDYPTAAREILGLSHEESSRLFYMMNKDKAKAMLAAVAAGDEDLFQEVYDSPASDFARTQW